MQSYREVSYIWTDESRATLLEIRLGVIPKLCPLSLYLRSCLDIEILLPTLRLQDLSLNAPEGERIVKTVNRC